MNCTVAIPKFQKDLLRIYMQSKYTASLRRAGVKALWIDTSDPEKAIGQMLQCDGLLLSGGEDIDPRLYGQVKTEKCGEPNLYRDETELRMLDAFFKTGKPILGICRGAQLMNVYFGGTLHQDIAHVSTCCHDSFRRKNTGCHSVTVTAGTKLAQMMEQKSFTVNSLHHQAVDQVGAGLVAAAFSQDGLVEAIAHSTHPFCLAVQWHPEHMSAFSPLQRKLFSGFAAACQNADPAASN